MSISSIRTILLAEPTVTDIVGDEIYVGFADQEVRQPFLVLDDLTIDPVDCKGEGDLDDYRFAVTAVGLNYGSVETVMNAVRNTLGGYSDSVYRNIKFAGIDEMYDGTQDAFIRTFIFRTFKTIDT